MRARYPYADFKIENRSIGGYSNPYLIRTMEADIVPFHPDLIVFRDYDSEEIQEKIIRSISSPVRVAQDCHAGGLADPVVEN